MKPIWKSLVFAAAVFAAPVTGHAQASAASVAGDWNATMNTPGGARQMKLVLRVDGDKVTGTVKREAGDVPLAGTVKGDVVTFTYNVTYNDNQLALTVSMKVMGDTMKGTVSFAGQAEDEFSATRVAKSPPQSTINQLAGM